MALNIEEKDDLNYKVGNEVIYYQNSEFIVKDSDLIMEDTKQSIEKGLFGKKDYNADDIIGRYRGTLKKRLVYDEEVEKGLTQYGYAIGIDEYFVLDCYHKSRSFECLLSYANSPAGCINKHTKLRVDDNCAIFCAPKQEIECPEVYLVCTKFIKSDDELLCLYGYEDCMQR